MRGNIQIENWIECGKCGTGFDLSKNSGGCPLCKFGTGTYQDDHTMIKRPFGKRDYLSIPTELKLVPGTPIIDSENRRVGSWGMFNDFFSGKAVCRTLAHIMDEEKKDYITLKDLIDKFKLVIVENKLQSLKGFPSDVNMDSAVNRLVYHFISTYNKMGLLHLKTVNGKDKIWDEKWDKILVTLTRDGLEFSKIRNKIFDDNDRSSQVLTKEESVWMINHLKSLDKKGYGEYRILVQVYSFLKRGNNGKNDLWAWFAQNNDMIDSVRAWSKKKSDQKAFKKQIQNLSQTFASGKLSLLRELGLVRDKRNDYTIVGDIQ